MSNSCTPRFCRFSWDVFHIELAFGHFDKIIEYFSLFYQLRY